VDVTAQDKNAEPPAWLLARGDDAPSSAEYPVSPLVPPEVPSHARPALAPLLESVRPASGTRSPSQLPPGLGRSAPGSIAPTALLSVPPPPRMPSMAGAAGFASQPPAVGAPSQPPPPARLPSEPPGPDAGAPLPPRERRRDTIIEELVPRAEEEAVAAIGAAIEAFAAERAQALELAERELVQLVKVICRRVVLREVTLSSAVIEALVQEGLSALGKNDQVIVKLGPFFADALDHISDNLHHRGIECRVVIDPAVGPHGCVLETALGRIDESVETRLNVLLASLDTVP
jgi:flagellar assembly protein FliH